MGEYISTWCFLIKPFCADGVSIERYLAAPGSGKEKPLEETPCMVVDAARCLDAGDAAAI